MRKIALILLFVTQPLRAATYQVGPTRIHANLNALFAAVNFDVDDNDEVDGAVAYAGDDIVPPADGGAVGNPVLIRRMAVDGQRSRVAGAGNAVGFRQSRHLVVEGFDISGGTSRSILRDAHDVTVRSSVIPDCPARNSRHRSAFELVHARIF